MDQLTLKELTNLVNSNLKDIHRVEKKLDNFIHETNAKEEHMLKTHENFLRVHEHLLDEKRHDNIMTKEALENQQNFAELLRLSQDVTNTHEKDIKHLHAISHHLAEQVKKIQGNQTLPTKQDSERSYLKKGLNLRKNDTGPFPFLDVVHEYSGTVPSHHEIHQSLVPEGVNYHRRESDDLLRRTNDTIGLAHESSQQKDMHVFGDALGLMRGKHALHGP